ncbi:hypothetical protein NSQ26_09740 [Bacillus sp. FSL W7-1360]
MSSYDHDNGSVHICVWKEIVGTPVPEAGTEQVLVYISDDDGENWNGKIMFTVTPDGNVSYDTNFGSDDFLDNVKDLFGLGDK